jgi:hypothetical protein
MWINPENSKHLLLANDGGVYSSYDEGRSWLHHNNIPTGEFYDITLDKNEPYQIYGGVQDDATVFGPSKELNLSYPDPWKYLWIDPWNGGDGCVTQVDPEDPNTIYFSMQNGAIQRMNMKSDNVIGIKPKLPAEYTTELKYNFITPYFISSFHSKTLYHGGNYVFKSVDRGDHWQVISGDLTISENEEKKSTAAGALEESPLKSGLLYFGSDNGLFWVTKNDGKEWENNSIGLPSAYIRSICPSAFKERRVYAALTGINYDDMNSYLFISEGYGEHWTSISANLPDDPLNVIAETPRNENLLFAGGHKGLYFSKDRGVSWSYFGNDMPTVSISDIEFHPESDDMIVSTHGRGIYKLNLLPLYETIQLDRLTNHLLTIPIGTRPRLHNTGGYIDYSTIEKIPVSFWLENNESITLSIIDNNNKIVVQKEILGKKGFNQYRWNMIIEQTESDMPYFVQYDKFIKKGEYLVRLKFGDEMLSGKLKIVENLSLKME